MLIDDSFNSFLKDSETIATELDIETSFTSSFYSPTNKENYFCLMNNLINLKFI